MNKYNNADIDKFNIISHIGKGSFSNVYLCKGETDNLYFSEISNEDYFIIKEININVLVNKYMKNSEREHRFVKIPHKKTYSDVSVNITPYTHKNTEMLVSSRSTEREYYYYKLKGLIESEIEILKMLNHNCVIKFNNYTESNYIYYLNLEYCDQGDVYAMLKNNRDKITDEFVYEFTKQTSDGLAYIHNNQIIHRDIKLQNILIKKSDDKYKFKISDFGFSCYDMSVLKKESNEYNFDEMLCKKYYKLCGTPYFMAPEIILNMNKLENFTFYDEERKINMIEFYDKRIDIWSYGICLYELITNRMPFSSLKDIKDIEKLYKKPDIQFYIDTKLQIINNEIFSNILYMCLKINEKSRCYIEDVCEELKKRNNKCINIIEKEKLNEIKNEKGDNSFLNIIKHIVSNPIKEKKEEVNNKEIKKEESDKVENESSYLMNSWEKINNSSSLMLKLSVEKGFLEWLLKK